MPISNYANGFSNGLTVRGVPIEIPVPGKVFWVNNSTVLADGGISGSNSNKGTYQQPFLTIDYAIGKCKANRGDVIYVMPGHVETVSTAAAGTATVDIDVAGISIIGLGRGAKQARFDHTAAAGVVTVTASNCSIINMNFHANVTIVTIGLSVIAAATNLLVKDCIFDVEDTTTDEFLIAINYGVGCNNFVVENTIIDMGLGGSATGIKLVGATAGGSISNCRIVGDYSFACIGGLTTASTEIYIEDNVLINGASQNVGTVAVLSMVAASSGLVRGNTFFCNVATGVLQIVSTGMFFSDNWHGEDTGSANTAGQSRGVGLNIVSIVPFADD